MRIKSYKEAGVNIEKGDAFTAFIGGIKSPAVSSGIGGFAGGIELNLDGIHRPVLLSTTDGVGTKLLVAKALRNYSTIGIDLVAMCVNDLIVCGVKPVVFLDYIACGALDQNLLAEVMGGIIRGCEEAGCVLSGGETAEMPDMYGESDIDLAGFCSGIGDRGKILPRTSEMRKGDLVLGLPSAGIHSNGLSLARKIITEKSPVYSSLLTPTKIYVSPFGMLLERGNILGAAHITGGGLTGNLERIVPESLKLNLSWDWEVPEIFKTIQRDGKIPDEEMRHVFNMGIGLSFVVHPEDCESLFEAGMENKIDILKLGELN